MIGEIGDLYVQLDATYKSSMKGLWYAADRIWKSEDYLVQS